MVVYYIIAQYYGINILFYLKKIIIIVVFFLNLWYNIYRTLGQKPPVPVTVGSFQWDKLIAGTISSGAVCDTKRGSSKEYGILRNCRHLYKVTRRTCKDETKLF